MFASLVQLCPHAVEEVWLHEGEMTQVSSESRFFLKASVALCKWRPSSVAEGLLVSDQLLAFVRTRSADGMLMGTAPASPHLPLFLLLQRTRFTRSFTITRTI